MLFWSGRHKQPGGQILRLRGSLEANIGPALAGTAITINEAFRLNNLRRVKLS